QNRCIPAYPIGPMGSRTLRISSRRGTLTPRLLEDTHVRTHPTGGNRRNGGRRFHARLRLAANRGRASIGSHPRRERQARRGRLVKSLGPFEGKPQPTPPLGDKRLRECQWGPAATIEVPKDWPSGVYLAKLSAAKHRYQSYCVFVVRDERPADILFQCSTNTW